MSTVELDPQPGATPFHDQLEVVAEGLGRYPIDVSLPRGHDRREARCPVVLVVDGNLLFDVAQVALRPGVHRSEVRQAQAAMLEAMAGKG